MAVPVGPRTYRIAVLVCHTFAEPVASERGQFDQIFAAWLEAAASLWNARRPASEQVALEVTGWDVVHKGQYPPSLDAVDAVVVTGSTASTYDEEPWIRRLETYVRDVYNHHPSVKIFGGCFGHQIISQALLSDHGVRVQQNPNGWEVGVHRVDVAPEFAARFPGLLADSKPCLSLQFLHSDGVTLEGEPPLGWIQMGSSQVCHVQGWLKPGHVLAYQGHPEFDRFINKLSSFSLGQLANKSSETLDVWMALVDNEDDRILAGEMALEFLLS